MKLNYDKKLNYLLGILIVVVILLFNFHALTQSPKNSGNKVEINESKTYQFGLIKTSAPISYYDDQAATWKGYCSALIEYLKKNGFPNIKIVEITKDEDRFKGEGSESSKIDAECGPNTINEERKQKIRLNGLDGKFSKTFGWTGATALGLSKNIQKLSPGIEFKTLKIGLPKGTTTINIVKITNPSLEEQKISYLEKTEDAINKLRRGEIDVYFNDEMILTRFRKKLNEEAGAEKYSVKDDLISNEEYGVVVYHTDDLKNKRLLEAINLLLGKAAIKSFGSTKLKILLNKNNPDFQNFIKNDLSYYSNKPSPDFWIKTVFILVPLIFVSTLPVLIKRYQNQNNSKVEIENNRIRNPQPQSVVKNQDKKVAHSLPYVHVTIHNKTNQSNTRRGNMSNPINFDQKNSNITVGNQGTNTNTNTQQFVQYTSEQKHDLSQFAKDIQRILEKVERNQPNATQVEKQKIVSYEIPPEQRSKIVRALQAGGEKALEELLDNPYLNIAIAVVKEWQREE
ncbi:MAG: transporter substrate-binding domain-containing protein [Nostoc sp.]|uniref:transporter substrate-binding domain-containing protein n=1 Tax=Nostoc sp. TaxID=1180 RepID=UPI002FF5D24E